MERAKLLKLSYFLKGVKDEQMGDAYKEAALFVQEKFSQHPVFKKYYADTTGEVYHITKGGHVTKMSYKSECKTQKGKYGYKVITVYDKDLDKRHTMTLHKFLWECWYKCSPAAGYDIDHQDGDHSNNTKENLRLLTIAENRGWRRKKA